MNQFAGAGLWSRDEAGLVPLDLLAPTRRELMLSLRIEGEASIDELSNRLHLTTSALRPHLAILDAEGYITLREAGTGPGRRRRIYAVSQHGEALFPGLGEASAIDLVRAAMEGTHDRSLLALFAFLRESRTTAVDRWSMAASAFARRGFLPLAAEDAVELRHCPLRALAHSQPLICQVEQHALACAAGRPVERVAHRLEGHDSCVYRLTRDAESRA